jgi:hypothetical protein
VEALPFACRCRQGASPIRLTSGQRPRSREIRRDRIWRLPVNGSMFGIKVSHNSFDFELCADKCAGLRLANARNRIEPGASRCGSTAVDASDESARWQSGRSGVDEPADWRCSRGTWRAHFSFTLVRNSTSAAFTSSGCSCCSQCPAPSIITSRYEPVTTSVARSRGVIPSTGRGASWHGWSRPEHPGGRGTVHCDWRAAGCRRRHERRPMRALPIGWATPAAAAHRRRGLSIGLSRTTPGAVGAIGSACAVRRWHRVRSKPAPCAASSTLPSTKSLGLKRNSPTAAEFSSPYAAPARR